MLFFEKYILHKDILWIWLSWLLFTNFCFPSRKVVQCLPPPNRKIDLAPMRGPLFTNGPNAATSTARTLIRHCQIYCGLVQRQRFGTGYAESIVQRWLQDLGVYAASGTIACDRSWCTFRIWSMVLARNDDLVGIFSLCIQPTATNLYSLSPQNTRMVLPRFGKILQPGVSGYYVLCWLYAGHRLLLGPT